MNCNNIIIEYQKIINLLDNTQNQATKFRTKNWVEINDQPGGTYSVNSQIQSKTSMLRSSLCDYNDAYILVSATITVPNTGIAANPNNRKNIIIKNCAPFTNCISETNTRQIENAKDIGMVMPMYNLTEYSDNYSKTSGSLWQYYRDESYLNNNGAIADLPADNNSSASYKFKTKIASTTGNDGTKNVKVRVPLKYLCKFWRTLEMPLINCEINLILTWSATCFIIDAPIANQAPTFKITDTKLYVTVVTLSTQDNEKLLQQLKSAFKRTI